MKHRVFTEVPEQVWEDLEYEIGRNGLEYADNYRAFRVRDGLYEEQFVEARKKGCCGSFETTTIIDDGEPWIIGCNYGH